VVQKQFGALQPRPAVPPLRTSCISVPMPPQLYCLNPPHTLSLSLRVLPQETEQSSQGKINLQVNATYFLLQKVTKPLPDKQGSCRHFSWVLNSCRKEAVCTWLDKTLRSSACPALWKSKQHNLWKNSGKPLQAERKLQTPMYHHHLQAWLLGWEMNMQCHWHTSGSGLVQ